MTENMEQSMVQLGVSIDMAPGLDGKVWPRIQFLNTFTAYTLCLPVEQFEAFVEQIYDKGLEVVKLAKLENSPIKVAPNMDAAKAYDNGQKRMQQRG